MYKVLDGSGSFSPMRSMPPADAQHAAAHGFV
jgi:hypothetical protein